MQCVLINSLFAPAKAPRMSTGASTSLRDPTAGDATVQSFSPYARDRLKRRTD